MFSITLEGDACKGVSFLSAIKHSIINNNDLNKYLSSYPEMGLRLPHAHMEKIIMNYMVNNNSDQTSQQADMSEAKVISIELGTHFYNLHLNKSDYIEFSSQEEACFSGVTEAID